MSDSDTHETDDEIDMKIEIKIRTEDLIREVEKRPEIYNPQLKDYNNRALKQQLWQEVCAALFKKWDTFSKAEKSATERSVQKRWKHTRDAFTRHHRNTQDPREKAEKKYVYHDLLTFLIPHFSERQKKTYGLTDDCEPVEKKLKLPEEGGCQLLLKQSHESRTSMPRKSSSSSLTPKMPKLTFHESEQPSTTVPMNSMYENGNRLEMLYQRPLAMPMNEPRRNPYERSLLSMLHEKINEEPDEDKHFALMLVPMLKKLDEDQKHYAKIEMLKVIRNAKRIVSSDSQASDPEWCNGLFFGDRPSAFESTPPSSSVSGTEPIDCSVSVPPECVYKESTGIRNKLKIKLRK